MWSMTTHQEENHPGKIESSCDTLIRHAPRAFDALQDFVQRSLPLLPVHIPLASLTQVLDVGCGRHLWGRDLFRTMVEQAGPELVADVRIEGIERCPTIVQAARQGLRMGRAGGCHPGRSLAVACGVSRTLPVRANALSLTLVVACRLAEGADRTVAGLCSRWERPMARTVAADSVRKSAGLESVVALDRPVGRGTWGQSLH